MHEGQSGISNTMTKTFFIAVWTIFYSVRTPGTNKTETRFVVFDNLAQACTFATANKYSPQLFRAEELAEAMHCDKGRCAPDDNLRLVIDPRNQFSCFQEQGTDRWAIMYKK